MESNRIKTDEEINQFLDTFLEKTKKDEKSKSLTDLFFDFKKERKSVYYSSQESDNTFSTKETESLPFIHARLDEIVTLINDNSIKNTDFTKLHKNQKQILNEIKSVQKQNDNLLQEITYLKSQNKTLKIILSKNTTDRRIRSVAAAFLILFSLSLSFYYIGDFELIQVFWTKVGIGVSTGVYLIGFFIGRMIKEIKISDGKD